MAMEKFWIFVSENCTIAFCDLLPDQVCLTAGKTQRNNSIVFSLSSIIEHY